MDMLPEIKDIVAKVADRKKLLNMQLKTISTTMEKEKEEQDYLIKTRVILNEALKITQQRFKERIEKPLTIALQSVFKERDIKFVLEIDIKRNSVECKPLVQEGDKPPYEPKDEMGGSLVDILSVVQRIVLWSLENPRSRALLILDEPFKWLGRKKEIQRAGELLKQIAKKGFQVIMVTHEPELAKAGDRVYYVEYDNTTGKSSVVPVEQSKLTWEEP